MAANRVYLVRHGEAKPETEDLNRPLADRGSKEITLVARHVAMTAATVSTIAHSGRLRARQTAEILAEYLHPPEGVKQISGLAPSDEPNSTRLLIEGADQPVMLVGHLPHLSRLLSLLVTGNSEMEVAQFHTGSIVSLVNIDDKWLIEWLLAPETLRFSS